MKLYIIAGEASGDLHASNLMKELKILHPGLQFRGWGGDMMREQGCKLVKHYSNLAFMGFAEVIANLGTILSNIRTCKRDIQSYEPDALILVDYPGFNLRIAEFAKNAGFRVFYYISPQIWAWKKSRVYKIKRYVDRMFVILPFEKEFYARYDYEVDFVGHPLPDAMDSLPGSDWDQFSKQNGLNDKPVVALLPGSRKQEIRKVLPIMLSVVSKFPDHQFVVGGAPGIEKDFYREIIGSNNNVTLISGQTYDLIAHAVAALVTSGTATLEAALFGIPEVVCYKGGYISYQIARRIVDRSSVKYISLVNLIMDKEVVNELIQKDLTPDKIEQELKRILGDETYRQKILNDYVLLKTKLGGGGASRKTAAGIMKRITA
jgi:lipid-A-disaccharide synthase